jgi:hypothetical protein
MKIGTRVKCNGHEGIVKSNAQKSHHGYCPEGMVIVQLPGGMTVVSISDCEQI